MHWIYASAGQCAPTQPSTPIKHGGWLASRVSIHLAAPPLLPQNNLPAGIDLHQHGSDEARTFCLFYAPPLRARGEARRGLTSPEAW
jgi:hypothetical protein